MAARNNPKREKQIESARKIAAATGEAHLDPEILFGRASNDDLELYTPEMLALSARSLGYRVNVLDPDSACPASPIADRVLAARFDDVGAMVELARSCDVVTVEIERIAQEGLAAAAKVSPTRPSAHVLSLAQDRRVEKGWLNENGFKTAPYRIATTLEEMTAAAQEFGSCVAKTAREYPISPKEHGTDFLMDNRHLWLRSKRQHAIMRIRHAIIKAVPRSG